MNSALRPFLLAALLCTTLPAPAADFDGSKPLICATVEVLDCVSDMACESGQPAEMGAPSFMRIDFAKQVVKGPELSSPFRLLEKKDGQVLLQGSELGFGWTLAIDQADGAMFSSLVNSRGVFVLHGSCTPL